MLPRALLGRDTSPGPRQASSVPLLSGRKVRNVPTPSPASPRPTEACPLPTVLVLSPFPRPCPRPGEVFHVSADPLQAVPPWRVWLACSTRLAAPAVVATVADHSPPANPFGYRTSVLSVALFCKPKSVIRVPSGFILLPCSGTKGLGKPKKDNSIPVGRSNDRFGFIRLMPPPSSEVRSFFTRICFGPMPRKRDRRSPSVGGRPTGGKIPAKPHPASVDLRDASLLPSKWSEKHICMTA